MCGRKETHDEKIADRRDGRATRRKFNVIFAADPHWRTLTPRLARSGLIPADAKLIERIVAVSK